MPSTTGAGLLLLLLACSSPLASSFSTPVTVYSAYTSTFPPCFRQPVLAPISRDGRTLLAFATGRNLSFCAGGAGDGPPPYLIVLRVSEDGGASWSEAFSTLYSGKVDYLGAVWDGDSSVHLFVQEGAATVLHSVITAGGTAWTPLVPISPALPKGVTATQPAVSVGLRLRSDLCAEPTCGGAAGRLVMPFVCHAAAQLAGDVACPGCGSCLLLSDDAGATWRYGAVSAQVGTREASVVQLRAPAASTSATLWATERAMGNQTGSRMHAVSSDGGVSFAFSTYGRDTALPDAVTANWTGVVSGAARFDGAPGGAAILFSAPSSRTERAVLGLYVSEDEAASWKGPTAILWPGPAAYSSMVQLNDTHVGVLFENGDAGTGDFAARLSFLTVGVSDLGARG